MKALIIALALVTFLSACATSPTGRKQLMLISPDAAIVQSKQAYLSTMQELDDQQKLVDDPALVQKIQTITGRLVTEAINRYPDSSSWEWSVAVIDDDQTVNAWCMAGGRMAIYTGIINQLNLTDDEIAQIMGHEISHALANHTAERMSRAMAMNAGMAAVGAATEGQGTVLAGAALAAKFALELPNSRTAEAEADRIGIELATRAGYAPEAAVSLWEKMGRLGGGKTPEFLSTHPSPDNRQQALSRMVSDVKQFNPNMAKSAVYPVTMVN